MSNALVLNQPQVNAGLVTCTCTIPTTLPGGYTTGGLFNAQKSKFHSLKLFATGTSTGSGAGAWGWSWRRR